MFSFITRPAFAGDQKDKSNSEKALQTLWIIIIVGFLGAAAFALRASNLAEFLSFVATGGMVAGASLLVGGLLGFLFGIPRTLQHDPAESVTAAEAALGDDSDRHVNYRANTNLEQISDWLTKILVGVGLTQINQIPGTFREIGNAVAIGLGNSESSHIFALSAILFFLICGFLFGYLWTRLFLPGAFRQADLSVLVNQVNEARIEAKQANQKVQEFEKQAALDAHALGLVHRQLNPSNDMPAVTQEALNGAIKQASHSVRVQIFNQAQTFRSANWDTDKEKVKCTIPIFRALIENDNENKYHRNHGQLGYALKDQSDPDWVEAEAELSKAIEIREALRETGWRFYEFNRALCRIKQDAAFKAGKASKAEARKKILTDLRVAAQVLLIRNIILDNPEIKEWMSRNSLTPKSLS